MTTTSQLDEVASLKERLAFAEAGFEYYRSGHLQNSRDEAPPPKFVPSKVRLNRVVRGDGPFAAAHAGPGDHECTCNRWGAVSVMSSNGQRLGVKLNEFDVLEFRLNDQ